MNAKDIFGAIICAAMMTPIILFIWVACLRGCWNLIRKGSAW